MENIPAWLTVRFRRLFPIAKLILSLPHSNAEEERLFSMVKLNKTFRSNLDPQDNLGKYFDRETIFKTEKIMDLPIDIPNDILTRAKKATWEYNILPFVFEAKRNFSLFFVVLC